MQYDTIKNAAAENLGLPKDAVLDLPLISITGDREMVIDNFKCIRGFSDKSITLCAGGGIKLVLCGRGLEITYLTKEELIIRGCFETITFIK